VHCGDRFGRPVGNNPRPALDRSTSTAPCSGAAQEKGPRALATSRMKLWLPARQPDVPPRARQRARLPFHDDRLSRIIESVAAGGRDLLLRWQASVGTGLWHEDVRRARYLTRDVCRCLHDKTSVIAQRARLLFVFHGLLLTHGHSLMVTGEGSWAQSRWWPCRRAYTNAET
jgi:hypothetical protein